VNHSSEILLGLFIVYIAAQIGAEVSQRLKMPAVVGELLAGVLIGPSVLGFIHVNEPLEVLAEIGAVLLLFSVGLETRISELKKIGTTAFMVGIAGVILPFLLGYLWAHLSGFDTPRAMFVAAAFVATSAGITARVLQEMGVLDRIESQVILGAAIIDDILAMLLLAVVTALQGGGINITSLLLMLLEAIGFVIVVVTVGAYLMKHSSHLLDAPISPHSPLTISVTLCIGLAVASSYFGLAAIIGAFLAGLVLSETVEHYTLDKELLPITALLVPFFFVVTGAKIDISSLGNISALTAVVVVTLLAVAGKLVGCGLGALSLGKKPALIIGMGMVPRGEVGIIVASLGLQANVITGGTYAIIIAMCLLTSIIAPPVLNILLADVNKRQSPG
jgi:Kef-type K+ transport system membrane component KefB